METPREVIQHWTAKMMADAARIAEMNATYKFVIDGPGGGSWLFRCKNPIGVEESSGAADCTLTLSSGDFVALANRKLNPQVAYLTGQIQIDGDIGQAMKLSNLI